MRKRFHILLVVLLVAVVGGLGWQVLRQREPVYQGKPLSYWLGGFEPYPRVYRGNQSSPDTATFSEATNAVSQIGSNAIPTLLRLLQVKDPPWKRKVFALLDKQKLLKIDHAPAQVWNNRAMSAFKLLGNGAKDAVPALIEMYQRNLPAHSQDLALFCLSAIGPAASNAIPALLEGITDSDAGRRDASIFVVGQIHSVPKLAVPVLRDSLKDANPIVISKAIDALGSYGADAKPAVPALIQLLKEPNGGFCASAKYALGKIDPEAAAKAGVK